QGDKSIILKKGESDSLKRFNDYGYQPIWLKMQSSLTKLCRNERKPSCAPPSRTLRVKKLRLVPPISREH
ncbi:hypothetical protein O9993_03890, partial [Vibrio lentus]|nr:hypothetical protein [Vibrio lentus]